MWTNLGSQVPKEFENVLPGMQLGIDPALVPASKPPKKSWLDKLRLALAKLVA